MPRWRGYDTQPPATDHASPFRACRDLAEGRTGLFLPTGPSVPSGISSQRQSRKPFVEQVRHISSSRLRSALRPRCRRTVTLFSEVPRLAASRSRGSPTMSARELTSNRKADVWGQKVSVSVDLGWRRGLKKKKKK